MEKDERTQSIEADHLSVAKKDSDDQIKIINDVTRIRLVDIIKDCKNYRKKFARTSAQKVVFFWCRHELAK